MCCVQLSLEGRYHVIHGNHKTILNLIFNYLFSPKIIQSLNIHFKIVL